jgi:hypothetical protein
MRTKFTFIKETLTCMVWAFDLVEASQMVGKDWTLVTDAE